MNRLPLLDFARTTADIKKRRFIVLAIFGLLLSVEFGLVAWQFQEIEGARTLLSEEQTRLKKRLKEPPGVTLTKEVKAKIEAAEDMLDHLTTPWERLLSALETAHQGKVIIESIRPKVTENRVEIGALASDFSEITGFIDRLSATGTLQQVVLLAETPGSDNRGSIRFVVTAAWSEVQ